MSRVKKGEKFPWGILTLFLIPPFFVGQLLETFQHVIWAGIGLVVVYKRNIFLLNDVSSRLGQQLTYSGSEMITNGVAEGMYRGYFLPFSYMHPL